MGVLEVPAIGEAVTASDPKIKKAIEALNTITGTENKVKGAGIEAGTIEGAQIKNETIKREDLAAESKPFTWYTPKVIATEQTRESASFGTLATADEIKEVVLPENGLILVGYQAVGKSSVAEAGKAAIFLGANQLKAYKTGAANPEIQEDTITGSGETTFRAIFTSQVGLQSSIAAASGAPVTTGQILGAQSGNASGVCVIFAAAATYNISIQFKATSGSVTAKERKLWVATLGF